MASRLNRTAAIVAASSVAAVGAYATGTRSDGAAVAAKRAASPQAAHPAHAERIADLADEFGVEAPALRTALEELRGELRPEGKDDVLAAIAKALGTTEAKVREAFENTRASGNHRGRGPSAAQLRRTARALGTTTAKLRAAMRDAREAIHGARRAEEAADLAKALGVDQAAVEKALEEGEGEAGRGRGDRGHGNRAAALADALGKTEAEVEAALGELHEARQAEMEARRDEFARKLAAKLGISEEKVDEVLGDGPFPASPGGHGRGPGGPAPGHRR